MFIQIQCVQHVHYGCTCKLVHMISKDMAKLLLYVTYCNYIYKKS